MNAKIIVLTVMVLGLVACATNEPQKLDDWKPQIQPVAPQSAVYENGSLFQSRGISLFEDPRPYRIGDVITIMLSESTKSSKKAATDTSKTEDVTFNVPGVLGATPTHNGNSLYAAAIDAERAFEGEGNSSQSNSLSGEITVTVVDVLANGNLVVKGEKWFTLNQGREYIRIAGIVRPQDISANNVVLSTKLADAQIAYSGEGFVHDSNTQGWLAQFFSSKWWPF